MSDPVTGLQGRSTSLKPFQINNQDIKRECDQEVHKPRTTNP